MGNMISIFVKNLDWVSFLSNLLFFFVMVKDIALHNVIVLIQIEVYLVTHQASHLQRLKKITIWKHGKKVYHLFLLLCLSRDKSRIL